MTEPRLHVVAAVLQRGEHYFIQQRQPGKHLAGLWEFPGGKVEPGETPWFALVRELKEELNISAMHGDPLIQLTHDYSDRVITLDVWRVSQWDGEPDPQERQVTAWRSLCEMGAMPLLPSDVPVLDVLR